MKIDDHDQIWQKMVGALESFRPAQSRKRHRVAGLTQSVDSRRFRGRLVSQGSKAFAIRFLQWINPNSALISWCDAMSGYYAEQTWKVVRARQGSVCALSGRRIGRGDRVLRPYARGRDVPGNSDAQILVVELNLLAVYSQADDQTSDPELRHVHYESPKQAEPSFVLPSAMDRLD